MNYYEILQVALDASETEISEAYKILSTRYHPTFGSEKDGEKFQQVEDAYYILSDMEKRKEYDATLQKQHNIIDNSDNQVSDNSSDTNEHEVDQPDTSEAIGKLFGYLFWIFVIACFVTNMEQYRMKLYNVMGKYEFNEEAGDCNVIINVEYKDKILRKMPKVWLNVDGKRVQVLHEGDDYDYVCSLSPGKHIVFIETKTLHANSEIYTFTVLPESEITAAFFTIDGRANWGMNFTMNNTLR